MKRVAGGPVSTGCYDHLKPGDTVRALGPMGDFSCFTHPAGKYLLLSGGSGVTPMMAMARTIHDLGGGRDVAFVHSARTPADIVFRDELAVMASRDPALRVHAICEADAPARRGPGRRAACRSRSCARRCRMSSTARSSSAVRSRTWMRCGAMLAEAGFDMARHHEESFDFGALPDADQEAAREAEQVLDAVPATGTRTFRVEFAKTKRVLECPEDQTVLDAARKAGIRLPSSCAKGLCAPASRRSPPAPWRCPMRAASASARSTTAWPAVLLEADERPRHRAVKARGPWLPSSALKLDPNPRPEWSRDRQRRCAPVSP